MENYKIADFFLLFYFERSSNWIQAQRLQTIFMPNPSEHGIYPAHKC